MSMQLNSRLRHLFYKRKIKNTKTFEREKRKALEKQSGAELNRFEPTYTRTNIIPP